MIMGSLEAAKQAKNMGLRVVLDAGTLRSGTLDLLPFIDYLITSRHFTEPLIGPDPSPEDSIEILKNYCRGEIVVTLGEEGSLGFNGRELIRQKAFPVQAIDTTGAGDVYHGAYIYGLLNEWEMQQCMAFASAASALKCRVTGARAGIPTLPQIKEFLKNE
jgi:ribokinase